MSNPVPTLPSSSGADPPAATAGPAPACPTPVDVTAEMPAEIPLIDGCPVAVTPGGLMVNYVPLVVILEALYADMDRFFLEKGCGVMARARGSSCWCAPTRMNIR